MGEACDTTRLQAFKSLHWLVEALSLSIQDMGWVADVIRLHALGMWHLLVTLTTVTKYYYAFPIYHAGMA